MATSNSVKSYSSALVTYAQHVKDRLADTLELTQYQQLYDDLKTRLSTLKLDRQAIADQKSQADQEEVLVNIDVARNWQIKLLERIHSLTVYQQVSATMPKKCHAKLPEIKLLTFSGNYDEWETFWSSFYNNVDLRDDLKKSAKLTYLLQSLEGEPREMIKGLSHTDANYIIAVTALQDRYADPIKQTEVLLQKFLTCLLLVTMLKNCVAFSRSIVRLWNRCNM